MVDGSKMDIFTSHFPIIGLTSSSLTNKNLYLIIGSTNYQEELAMRQFCIIILISFTGEFLSNIIPLPIPGSIYGLVIMLSILRLKSLNQIQDTAEFLLDIMILMLIPTAVGLIESWRSLKEILLPVAIITVVTSVLVMVVTGWVTQLFVWKRGLENE